MSDKRPLIFIKPYSETLQKLFEVCNEIKDQENFEIFEIESNAEFAQVIVSAGASLTLFSSLKKCALILQEQKRNIFRMKSKVILLSPKNIDRKIHEKFTKIGLTEMVVEPIAPKTLVHKVKLLLRSLPKTQVESDTDDQTVKSGEDAATPEAAGQATKSDGGKYNKIDGFMSSKTKDKKTELQLSDDDVEKKPEAAGVNYLEEALSKKRKTYKEEELQAADNKSQTPSEAEKIETHYRSKENNDFQLTDDEREKKKLALAEVEDSVIENDRKSSLVLNKEAEGKRKKATKLDLLNEEETKSATSLALEDEEKKGRQKTELLLAEDKNKKGVNTLNLDIDEEKDKKAAIKLLLKKEAEEIEQKAALEEKEEKDRKKLQKLELENELEEKAQKKTLDKEVKEKANNTKLELENKNETLDDAETSPAEFIDKYYRNNGKEKTDEEVDQKQVQSLDKRPLATNARELPDNLPQALEEPEILDEDISSIKLNLSSDAEEKTSAAAELEDIDVENKIPINLDLENEAELKSATKEKVEKEKSLEDKLSKLDLEDTPDDPALKAAISPEVIDPAQKPAINLDLEPDVEGEKRPRGKVDHLTTHYGMKTVDRDIDQNWDKLKKGDNVTKLADVKRKNGIQDRAFEFDAKNELEFNFEKVKKEFAAVDPFFRNLKVKYGSIDYENNVAVDFDGNRVPLDEALEAMIAENQHLLGEVQSLETDQLFLVSPLGITGMIEASAFYHDKKKKGTDLLKFLAKKVFDDYGAITTFVQYDLKAKTQKNWYAGHIELDLPNTDRGQREAHWQAISHENQQTWKNINETTNFENLLIYPFQEGVTNLGIAVVEFSVATDENRIQGIQNILGCALGLYYQEHHATMTKKEETKKTTIDDSKPAGFFSKVFGIFSKKAS